jgi:hypothetical protein
MTDVLSATELASIRSTTLGSLPSTCVISRTSAGGTDAYGGETAGSVTPMGTVACGIGPLGSPRPIYSPVAGGAEVFVTWAIRFPHGTDVQAGDDVTSGGETFEVHQVDTPRSHSTEIRALATSEAT